MTAPTPPPWLVNAVKYLGFHETGTNQGIEQFIALAHTGSLGDPWCAIFANACLEEAGFPGTRSALARSFETNPNFVQLPDRAYGCITTMWRTSLASGQGHVYFYMGENENGNIGLGGNEDDQVEQEYLPQSRVTGYWWPKSFSLPPIGSLHVDASVALNRPTFATPSAPGTTPLQSGKGSWYSQYQGKYSWVDKGDGVWSADGTTYLGPNNALGVPDNQQGCSFLTRTGLGKWFEVHAPNGAVLTLRQTDIGPAASTGRLIDIAAVSAEAFGYSPHNFPTDGTFSWRPALSPQPAPPPQPTIPVPPMPDPAPIPTPPPTTPPMIPGPVYTQDQLAQITAYMQKQTQPMWTALLASVVGMLPQLGVWGLVAQQVLVAMGQMGAAVGTGATPVGQSVGATLLAAVVSGLLSQFNKAITPSK